MPKRNDPCPCGSGKKYKKCCMVSGGGSAPATPALGVAELVAAAVENHQAGHLREADGFYRAALEQDARHLGALVGRAQILERLGEFEEAARMLGRAITVQETNPDLHVMLAGMLMPLGRTDDALDHARRASTLNPRHVRARTMAAEILARTNRTDEAIAEVDAARAIDPDDATAVLMLANLRRRRGELDEARALLETLLDGEGDSVERAWGELGFVLDGLGEHEAAFDAFDRAGHERFNSVSNLRVDRQLWGRALTAYRAAVTPELLARHADLPDRDPAAAPAFLVGFPRSGTTLTEQVLAAHPAVATVDEEPLVLELVAAIARRFNVRLDEVPGRLADLDEESLIALRHQYRARIAELADADAAVVVDKLPLNIMHAGLINLVFPEARLIVALRDPRDVCLSCFMQRFGLNPAMINFLWWNRTIEFYAEVMGAWLDLRDRLTAPRIEIRYEDTVADLQTQARRLLERLDLEWDPAVLAFHEKARERFISTPSFAAVTEAVTPKAIGRWRNYARHFEGVEGTLRPFVEAFGYG